MLHETELDRGKPFSIGIALAAAVAARVWFVVAHRIDSDEPQHLHIAWAWAQGLVQYRDVFDNHLPLLHLLFAPLLAGMPESSDVFVRMRWAITPFAIGAALLLFFFVKPLLGARVAISAALLFSVMPVWLPHSVEFRNDTLWIFFWLAALALLARPRGPMWIAAGIAFGLSLLASIKAVPLLLAHVLAFATMRQLDFSAIRRFAMGITVPLLTIGGAMFAAGALDDMLYGTLLFNAAAPVHPARRIGGVVGFVIVSTVIAAVGTNRAKPSVAKALALFSIWYVAVLLAFWPILTPRDFLPLVPVAAIAIAMKAQRLWLLAFFAAIVTSAIEARIFRPHAPTRQQFVDAVVRTTGENDLVFDLKGDAVFRRRAASVIYEDVGRALTANGTIPDRGPEEIVARRCCAAVADSTHLPPRTRAFLNAHFVGDGLLRVCGTDVRGSTFEIAVPQTYAVIARDPSHVTIDGTPYRGPRALGAGLHTISNGGNDRVRVIWWRAAKEDL